MNPTERLKMYDEVVQDARMLFSLRNAEYGDGIEEGGVVGAVVEFIGCVSRLKQVVLHRSVDPETKQGRWHEIVHDKLVDALNYSIIGLMMLAEGNLWGK